jgi:hypothetical protein
MSRLTPLQQDRFNQVMASPISLLMETELEKAYLKVGFRPIKIRLSVKDFDSLDYMDSKDMKILSFMGTPVKPSLKVECGQVEIEYEERRAEKAHKPLIRIDDPSIMALSEFRGKLATLGHNDLCDELTLIQLDILKKIAK